MFTEVTTHHSPLFSPRTSHKAFSTHCHFFIHQASSPLRWKKKKTDQSFVMHLLSSLFIGISLGMKGELNVTHGLQESVGGGKVRNPLGMVWRGPGGLPPRCQWQGQSTGATPCANIFLDELSSAHLPRSPAACGLKAVGWARGGGRWEKWRPGGRERWDAGWSPEGSWRKKTEGLGRPGLESQIRVVAFRRT